MVCQSRFAKKTRQQVAGGGQCRRLSRIDTPVKNNEHVVSRRSKFSSQLPILAVGRNLAREHTTRTRNSLNDRRLAHIILSHDHIKVMADKELDETVVQFTRVVGTNSYFPAQC